MENSTRFTPPTLLFRFLIVLYFWSYKFSYLRSNWNKVTPNSSDFGIIMPEKQLAQTANFRISERALFNVIFQTSCSVADSWRISCTALQFFFLFIKIKCNHLKCTGNVTDVWIWKCLKNVVLKNWIDIFIATLII